MHVVVLDDAESVARYAADLVAAAARSAVTARGRFTLAVSGGRTPWLMLRTLSGLDLSWDDVHVGQADERVAPAGDPDRNLTHLRASLPAQVRIHAMPVEAPSLDRGAAEYAQILVEVAGAPPVFDVVHLGLGSDGHTASLIPGDPVLDVADADVAVTGVYQGRRRMTLTYPAIDRARHVMWLITGEDKAAMLARLCLADRSIPAGRVRQQHAQVIADRAAARLWKRAGG
jgi:6-phosphogluconolactonase